MSMVLKGEVEATWLAVFEISKVIDWLRTKFPPIDTDKQRIDTGCSYCTKHFQENSLEKTMDWSLLLSEESLQIHIKIWAHNEDPLIQRSLNRHLVRTSGHLIMYGQGARSRTSHQSGAGRGVSSLNDLSLSNRFRSLQVFACWRKFQFSLLVLPLFDFQNGHVGRVWPINDSAMLFQFTVMGSSQ